MILYGQGSWKLCDRTDMRLNFTKHIRELRQLVVDVHTGMWSPKLAHVLHIDINYFRAQWELSDVPQPIIAKAATDVEMRTAGHPVRSQSVILSL